jgi:tryptophan-rich sensory protein
MSPPDPVAPLRFRWWHGAAILLAADAISVWPALLDGPAVFLSDRRLPPFAPPAWAFAPVWFLLNVSSLACLALIVNGAPAAGVDAGRRRVFLVSEAIGWLLFAAFTTLYFWMDSPVLGAIDTVLELIVVLVSLACAVSLSRAAAALLVPRLLWLLLATGVALWVALHNPDPLFG